VLLAARDAGSDARAALNVRYDPTLVDALGERGHVATEFEAEAPIREAIGDALRETPGATVLYQTGGFGIEPVMYVFAPDATTAAARVRDCF
jgi:hypothetical protein